MLKNICPKYVDMGRDLERNLGALVFFISSLHSPISPPPPTPQVSIQNLYDILEDFFNSSFSVTKGNIKPADMYALYILTKWNVYEND